MDSLEQALAFVEQNPTLGLWAIIFVGIWLLIRLLKGLSEMIPAIKKIKASIYLPASKWFKFESLRKSAIKADIEGNVNQVIGTLRKELPEDWMPEISISWVKNETKEDFLSEKKAVIRMRPVEEQETNFVNAVYLFFLQNCFPKSGKSIPEITKESCVLQISRSLIYKQKPEFQEHFDDEVLEPAIQKKEKILNYLDRYSEIDKKGFFTGTFLREIHSIAKKSRFSKERNSIAKEASELLKHIETFAKGINAKTEDEKLKASDWKRFGLNANYGFLLVANPNKTQSGEQQYINRVQQGIAEGIDRFYIFSTREEKNLLKRVMTGIQTQIPECKMIEFFELSRDYRGNKSGYGVIFEVKNSKS